MHQLYVDLAAGLKQLYLVGESTLGKHTDGFFIGGLIAAKGHVEVDDFLHALIQLLHVVIGQLLASLLLEVAIVAARDSVLNEQFGTGEDILRSFVKHKAQRAHIGMVTATFAGIEKFNVAVLV